MRSTYGERAYLLQFVAKLAQSDAASKLTIRTRNTEVVAIIGDVLRSPQKQKAALRALADEFSYGRTVGFCQFLDGNRGLHAGGGGGGSGGGVAKTAANSGTWLAGTQPGMPCAHTMLAALRLPWPAIAWRVAGG